MNTPKAVEVWKAKDGSLVVDTRDNEHPLFPAGVSATYQLEPENARAAVKLLRCPEAFGAMVEGYISSKSDTPEGQLDDALKYVVKYFSN